VERPGNKFVSGLVRQPGNLVRSKVQQTVGRDVRGSGLFQENQRRAWTRRWRQTTPISCHPLGHLRSDTVSRLGGDEFAVLLSQVERAEDAVFSAKKILSALAAPYSIDQKHLDINASIGVSTYPCDGHDAETLIQKADTAMYDAKKPGRNSYQFFRADMQARVFLSADAGAATIVTAMINIGKSLHHRVIAEGVETREQVHFLQKQGCGEGQGYFFCHPVIAEKFAQFLESGLRESVVH